MAKYALLLLISLATLLLLGGAQHLPVTATLSPLRINTLLGSTAVFHCHATGAFILDWDVDGIQVNDNQIRLRGIVTHTVTVNDVQGEKVSNLTVPASFKNNQSTIQCLSIPMSGPSFSSEVGTLLIQGLLDGPKDVILQVTSGEITTLAWSPPFTLNLTSLEPHIVKYSVYTYCDLPINVSEPQINVNNMVKGFYISAWNAAGEGDKTFVQYTYHQQATYAVHVASANGSKSLCFTCFIRNGSLSKTLGCHVTVFNVTYPLISVDLIRESNNKASGCVDIGIDEGSYTVQAYDINSTGDVDFRRGGITSLLLILGSMNESCANICNKSEGTWTGLSNDEDRFWFTMSIILCGGLVITIAMVTLIIMLFQARRTSLDKGSRQIAIAGNDAYGPAGRCGIPAAPCTQAEEPHYAEVAI